MSVDLIEMSAEPDMNAELETPADSEFSQAKWNAIIAELDALLAAANRTGESAGGFEANTSKSTNFADFNGTSGRASTGGAEPYGGTPYDVAPSSFGDTNTVSNFQGATESDFEVTSASALSGRRSADFGGEQIFDWTTTAPAGKNLSRADLSNMNASTFQANQAIANDSNSFTVIPSTTGHEGLKATFDTEPAREAVVSFTAEFGEGTDFVKGGKLMGFSIGEGATGGESDPNGGSVRLMFRENGQLEVYSYHQDQKIVWGDSTESGVFVKPGEAFDVDLKVRANDAGQSNGGFDLYVNGDLVVSQDGMRFTQDGGDINAVLADIFWGGLGKDWEAKAGSSVKIDDLEAYKLR